MLVAFIRTPGGGLSSAVRPLSMDAELSGCCFQRPDLYPDLVSRQHPAADQQHKRHHRTHSLHESLRECVRLYYQSGSLSTDSLPGTKTPAGTSNSGTRGRRTPLVFTSPSFSCGCFSAASISLFAVASSKLSVMMSMSPCCCRITGPSAVVYFWR